MRAVTHGNILSGARSKWGTAFLVLALGLGAAVPAGAGEVDLVSRVAPDQISDTGGGAEFQGTYPASMSSDGRYVAFLSPALNLVPGQEDHEGSTDVFLRDLVARTTILVSRSAASPAVAAGLAGAAVVSPDGRYVAWSGLGTDVVAGQVAGRFSHSTLFLFDRVAGTNRILVASAALQNSPEGFGASPRAFSADGRFLLFRSGAPDVVPGQSGDPGNLFLYDLNSGAVTLVSHASGSAVAGVGASGPAPMSADGRFIAFVSSSGQLLVFDRLSGALEDLGPGSEPALSRDGRFVAFLSNAVDRVPGQVDTNGILDIFLYDRTARSTVLVTRALSSAVETGNGALLSQPVLSPDGRSVAFVSRSTNLVPGQENALPNLFLFDRTAGTVRFVTQASFTANLPPNELREKPPAFSGDGRSLVFYSSALNVIPGQVNPEPWIGNLFLYDLASRALTLITASSSAGSPTVTGGVFRAFQISEDGRVVVFASNAENLVPGLKDRNEAGDVFSYSVATGDVEALSLQASPSATPARGSSAVAISADGRWIVFESTAAHLVSGQVDLNTFRFERRDLFLYDVQTRATRLVSHASGSPGTTGDSWVSGAALSADGRFVAFTSEATNLVPIPGIFFNNVFLFDRETGSLALVSRSAGSGQPAGGRTEEGALSADGRYLAFTSGADDLVPGQIAPGGPGALDVFLYDRVAGSMTLVSHSSAGPLAAGNGHSDNPRLSGDGRYVLFTSRATDLVSGQTGSNGDSTDLFLYDRITGATSLVSHARTSKTEAAGIFGIPALSADGRYAAFWSRRADLGGVNGSAEYNLYLYDRAAGTNTLVSSFGPVPEDLRPVGEAPFLSRDGRIVAFVSPAPLVPGQSGPAGKPQVFLYDRTTGKITLASRAGSSPTIGMGGGGAISPSLSADGRSVAFAGSLPENAHLPDTANIFVFDRVTQTTVLASPSRSSAATGAGGSREPRISADGRSVAFTSSSADLDEPDFNASDDAFVFRLSSAPGGPVALPPCTLFDTRRPAQGPALRSNVRKSVAARGVCGVPASAAAVLVKVTALQGKGKGNLRLLTGNATTPSGILRFEKRKTRSGQFTVPLAADGTFTILPFVAGNGTVQVAVEVNGYSQ